MTRFLWNRAIPHCQCEPSTSQTSRFLFNLARTVSQLVAGKKAKSGMAAKISSFLSPEFSAENEDDHPRFIFSVGAFKRGSWLSRQTWIDIFLRIVFMLVSVFRFNAPSSSYSATNEIAFSLEVSNSWKFTAVICCIARTIRIFFLWNFLSFPFIPSSDRLAKFKRNSSRLSTAVPKESSAKKDLLLPSKDKITEHHWIAS